MKDIEALAVECGAYKYLEPSFAGNESAWRYIFKPTELEAFAKALQGDVGEQKPVLYAVNEWELALHFHNGATLCTASPTELHSVPLFTSPPNTQALQEHIESLQEKVDSFNHDDCNKG